MALVLLNTPLVQSTYEFTPG
eukprot:COSAG01_NODE_54641_length_330_cov_5.428571_2_plen_20_part_01